MPSIVSVSIDEGERSVEVGATLFLSATVEAVGGATSELTWHSSDTGIATVDHSGAVAGIAAGEARITASSLVDSSQADSVLITVIETPAVAGVIINEPSVVLTVGSTTGFTATVQASGGASDAVTWHSDRPTVATVDTDGLVEALSLGVATITAVSVFDPSRRAAVAVVVQAQPEEPGVPATITAVAGDAQTTMVASAVPIPPSVRVSDAEGSALAGVSVSFTVIAGGGAIAPTTPVTTDSDGIARLASWTLGTSTGLHALRASVTGRAPIATTFSATARPGPPSPSTSTATASPATVLADGAATSLITIRLRDQYGHDLDSGGATITFASLTHGSIGPVTDHGDGSYGATYTAGTRAGTVTVIPRLGGANFVNTATVTLTGAVFDVTIDQPDLTLRLGESLHLTASVDAVGGASTAVTWSSSDASVASIDPTAGVATANAGGTATISATSVYDPEQRDEVTITVPAPMILSVETSPWSTDASVTLSLRGTVDVTIDWGDGTWTSATAAGDHEHTYSAPGTYTVRIAGRLDQFGGSWWLDGEITGVTAWGDLGLISLSGAFARRQRLQTLPPNLPPTVTDTSWMFVETWFTGDLSTFRTWDVSNVTNMRGMFSGGESWESVNADIGGWDVSSVTDMSSMFSYNLGFDRDIGGWDVSNVTNMAAMFVMTDRFDRDLSRWDVSNVTSMSGMFAMAPFDQDIGGWDVSNVTNMAMMFGGIENEETCFNRDISGWDVSNVTDMSRMFQHNMCFDQDISGWDVSNVTDMNRMFSTATSFNQDISSWDVSRVLSMAYMFAGHFEYVPFNQDLSGWCVSNIPEAPPGFDSGAVNWTLPRPVWGTCPVRRGG